MYEALSSLNLCNPGPSINWSLCPLRNYWFKIKRVNLGGVLQERIHVYNYYTTGISTCAYVPVKHWHITVQVRVYFYSLPDKDIQFISWVPKNIIFKYLSISMKWYVQIKDIYKRLSACGKKTTILKTIFVLNL